MTKIYLKDYRAPNHTVSKIALDIKLYDDKAIVASVLNMHKVEDADVVLLGRQLQLQGVWVNDVPLSTTDYSQDDEMLVIKQHAITGNDFTIKTIVHINPHTNTALEGLYTAGSGKTHMFVTQCEPEGFRKITFFPDRPDILAEYTTRLEASTRYPVLLSNGNLLEKGTTDDGRHYAIWHDPTKKPSYLFACVAADLDVLEDSYTTKDGKDVLLQMYAEPQDIDKCHIGMQALKDAMAWDEKVYGLSYDLDRYMIVATSQFNMGAMENKGLNIFNTACVLSHPDTTTDRDNHNVKAVIAHEYFHNWTGNRVTCRDWFQLCLKEGLTVFRDQSFSADHTSFAVQRINDVSVLRAAQFSEDAGALAHPVRPFSFVEINNFYTATVYEKGAEIVRMMAELLGKDGYKKGMDAYFAKNDGKAVTVEDFIDALATTDARIKDFMRWYEQPGTPVLSGSATHDAHSVRITLSQKQRHISGFDAPKPLPIPVKTAVFDAENGALLAEKTLLLTDARDEFVLDVDLQNKTPLVSVLRSFSAPVVLDFDYSNDELAALVKFETDGFNRWQAMQMLVERYLDDKNTQHSADKDALIQHITKAQQSAVDDLIDADPMLCARLFDIASQKELAISIDENYRPKVVAEKRDALKQNIATALAHKWRSWYQKLPMDGYKDTGFAAGQRALRNVVLQFLAIDDKDAANTLATEQYNNATCMTERFGALSVMVHHQLPVADAYLNDFYSRFAHEDLVIDDWFALKASADNADVSDIKALLTHEDFDYTAPNRVRSVLGSVLSRPVFLWSDEGLTLFLDALLHLDGINPQMAARLAGGLARWHTLYNYHEVKPKLTALLDKVQSKNTKEVLGQILNNQ